MKADQLSLFADPLPDGQAESVTVQPPRSDTLIHNSDTLPQPPFVTARPDLSIDRSLDPVTTFRWRGDTDEERRARQLESLADFVAGRKA